MPIILEVNDYDSEDDVSSTEDDNNNETNIKNKTKKKIKKNKKVKSKKIPLKESKIVKDTAKKKIKNMEKQILKIKYEYSEKNYGNILLIVMLLFLKQLDVVIYTSQICLY